MFWLFYFRQVDGTSVLDSAEISPASKLIKSEMARILETGGRRLCFVFELAQTGLVSWAKREKVGSEVKD